MNKVKLYKKYGLFPVFVMMPWRLAKEYERVAALFRARVLRVSLSIDQTLDTSFSTEDISTPFFQSSYSLRSILSFHTTP